ncbi:hypothetical protein ACLKA7_003014 [Drosophila subpalustris]
MESSDAGTPNPNPFQNWREMLTSLPQQEETTRSEQRPRSALRRYQQRRAAHAHVHGYGHGRQPGAFKRRSNKRGRCNKCRLLGRKNKQMNRLVKRLRGKLQRLNVDQSPDNVS